MRCSYCGNENPDEHRFCGMCGKPLPEPTAELEAAPQESAPSRPTEPISSAPAYTGGIFNLGAPADSASRNLDYLLDDDDEPKSRKGWVLAVVVALALVGGLGWLRWRREGLPLIGSPSSAKSSTPVAPATTDSSASPSTPAPEAPASTPPASSSAPAAPTPPPTAPAAATTIVAAPDNAAASTSAPTAATHADQPPASAPADSGSNAGAAPPSTADSNTSAPSAAPKAAGLAPVPAPAAKPTRKPAPSPAPKPAAKPDPVTVGEQYLYGRNGVPQNCDRGLHYVKPAADQSNTKAMITMGALYATGHCLSRDLPTAYRYFALALRSDPENGPLRQNVDMVWKQMTAEERKQAIRLTQ